MYQDWCLRWSKSGSSLEWAKHIKEQAIMQITPMPMTQALASRISLISVSSTMKVMADAERLRREGADVVDFGAGEPDFPTPDNIKQAAIDAIHRNFTKYTNTRGTEELNQGLCDS